MSNIAGIAASGLRMASMGMHAAAHNVANLSTPAAERQAVAASSLPEGGVAGRYVAASADTAAPLDDLTAMIGYRSMAGANAMVLKVADQTLGSLLDAFA